MVSPASYSFGFPPPIEQKDEECSIHTLLEEYKEGRVTMVDVREKSEWDLGHIKDAYFFPLSDIRKQREPDFPVDNTLYLYCRSGNRVKEAKNLMGQYCPHIKVKSLSFGFEDLVQEGFPSVTPS